MVFFSTICEVFDSLGGTEDFIHSLPRYRKSIEFNSTQLQSPSSDKCGQFAACFLLLRIFNLDISFSDCVSTFFTSDFDLNEKKVLDFIENNE